MTMAEALSIDDREARRARRQLLREVEVLLAAVDAATTDLAAARSPQMRRLLDAACRTRSALRATPAPA
jgi:hypothetical protein